jgi:undecaprenyl-diphosphatase
MATGLGTTGVGVVGAGVIAVLVVISAVAVRVARHPTDLRRWSSASRPLRFARIDKALARVSDRLGVSLAAVAAGVAGLSVVALLAVGFADLLDDVLDGGGAVQFDEPIVHWLAGHREAVLTDVLLVVTRLGNNGSQTLYITVVSIAAAVVGRSRLPILVAVAGGGGIGLVIWAAKHVVGRHRPPFPDALISPGGFSFPSGHATGAATVGLLCAWMSCRWLVHRWVVQVAIWAVTVALIVLIGFSRVYLGVHFPTDVLAGWFLGSAWAGIVIVLAEWWSNSSRHRRPIAPGFRSPPRNPTVADSG